MLYVCPDKTIKLWKITEKAQQAVDFNNVTEDMRHSVRSVRVPKYQSSPLTVEAVERRTYANAHAYHINSVSLNSDVATFLSADDLRINLWNIENNKECFSILHSVLCGMSYKRYPVLYCQCRGRHIFRTMGYGCG